MRKDDVVVSIGGSGDIPFAIAPYVSKVYVVDSNHMQVGFMKEQIEHLNNKDWDSFLRMDLRGGIYDVRDEDFDNRKDYFSGRLDGVSDSLSKIEVIFGDVFNVVGKVGNGALNKLYLSNVFDYMGLDRGKNLIDKNIDSFGSKSLIYNAYFFSSNDKLPFFEEDFDKTELARKNGFGCWGWEPTVHVKRC